MSTDTAVLVPGTPPASPAASPRLRDDANFRWLFAGSAISMLGDQFTLVALPWLVLSLTGDPLALGGVVAAMGVPRAIFLLVGGALVDRYAPVKVLAWTKAANAALLATLVVLGATGALTMPVVMAIAIALGLVTAFSYPAGNSVLPRVFPRSLLARANSVFIGARQVTMLVGPLIAGLLVAASPGLAAPTGAGAGASHGAIGAGLLAAFAIDAGSFVLSGLALLRLRIAPSPAPAPAPAIAAPAPGRPSLGREIAEAARAFWADRPLRVLSLYYAAIACFVGGPVSVALPVLASRQLAGGAAALGLLMAGHGAGILGGVVLAGAHRDWRVGTLGRTVLVIDAVAAAVFAPFGHLHSAWLAAGLLAVLGAFAGFVQVAVMAWMQARVPAQRLGRTMSLFMCLILGGVPLSSALAGLALRVMTPAGLFTASAALMFAIVLAGAALGRIDRLTEGGPAAP